MNLVAFWYAVYESILYYACSCSYSENSPVLLAEKVGYSMHFPLLLSVSSGAINYPKRSGADPRGFVGFGRTPPSETKKVFEAILVGRGLNLVT